MFVSNAVVPEDKFHERNSDFARTLHSQNLPILGFHIFNPAVRQVELHEGGGMKMNVEVGPFDNRVTFPVYTAAERGTAIKLVGTGDGGFLHWTAYSSPDMQGSVFPGSLDENIFPNFDGADVVVQPESLVTVLHTYGDDGALPARYSTDRYTVLDVSVRGGNIQLSSSRADEGSPEPEASAVALPLEHRSELEEQAPTPGVYDEDDGSDAGSSIQSEDSRTSIQRGLEEGFEPTYEGLRGQGKVSHAQTWPLAGNRQTDAAASPDRALPSIERDVPTLSLPADPLGRGSKRKASEEPEDAPPAKRSPREASRASG